MFRWFFIFSSMIFFLGCSSMQEGALYNKRAYNKNLKYTQKAELFNNDGRTITLNATYIKDKNSYMDSTKEKFIVNVMFDDLEDNNISFKNTSLGYKLTLDGRSALYVKRLNLGDKRLKNISFLTKWSDIYEVVFPHIDSNSFSLILSNPKYGSKKLHFSKVAKYTYKQELFLDNNSIF